MAYYSDIILFLLNALLPYPNENKELQKWTCLNLQVNEEKKLKKYLNPFNSKIIDFKTLTSFPHQSPPSLSPLLLALAECSTHSGNSVNICWIVYKFCGNWWFCQENAGRQGRLIEYESQSVCVISLLSPGWQTALFSFSIASYNQPQGACNA